MCFGCLFGLVCIFAYVRLGLIWIDFRGVFMHSDYAQNTAINMTDVTKIFESGNACAASDSGCAI